ncbi:MAG: Dot/Icm secretion system protein IcmQ [Silvanigrellaceae bacterium]|nr:Dot/Icm secretion system protein IcmQ [Silvanigrellaceae bacterium]
MTQNLTEEQTEAILKALDDAIETGPWEESNFLRVIGKNLKEIRSNFADHLANEGKTVSSTQNKANQTLESGQKKVFVSLYSFEGNNLQSWERILANLPRQMISRPIYENEEHLKFLIKSKENKVNEAYVAIHINPQDILSLSVDKTPIDKFGKPLLSLKDRSLDLDNVLYFVHFSGNYHYIKGRLVKVME